MSKQPGLPLKYKAKDKWPEGYVKVTEQFDWSKVPDVKVWGLDIETTGLNPYDPHTYILTISLSYATGKGFGFQVGRKKTEVTSVALKWLRDLLGRDDIMVVGHNIKYDLRWLIRKFPSIKLNCMVYDTQVASYFTNENEKRISLEKLTDRYEDLRGYKDDIDRSRLEYYNQDDVLLYNIKDADGSRRLRPDINKVLKEDGLMGPMNLFSQVLPILTEMEAKGIRIDVDYAKKMQGQLVMELVSQRRKLKEMSGSTFSPDSHDQLKGILYGKFGFNVDKVTDKGKPCTDYESLLALRRQVETEVTSVKREFIDLMIEYTKNKTMNNNYYKKVPSWVQWDGFVHPEWNLTGTTSGRLSCKDPNIQAVKRGPGFRGVFRPTTDDHIMIEGDASQGELRIIAQLAKVKKLLKAFEEGLDPHTDVLCNVFSYEYDKVSKILDDDHWPVLKRTKKEQKIYLEIKNQRVGIKNVNFGIAYGATAPRLQRELAKNKIIWTLEQCQDLIDKHEEEYPEIHIWKTGVEDFIIENWYVPSPFGQIRRLPNADRHTGDGRAKIREGINFIIQSSLSYYTLSGMVLIQEYFRQVRELKGRILAQVHDSILAELIRFRPEKLLEIQKDIETIMSTDVIDYIEKVFNFKLTVPMVFKTKIISRWE